jgi:thiol-disulfide isomerase/thioredoxin
MEEERRSSRTSLVFFLVLAAAVLLYVFVLQPLNREAQGMKSPGVGKKLAQLSLRPLTGTPPPLELADIQGNVTLLNFWGTWCPPCRIEFPHLANLEKQYRGRDGFLFCSVSCGYDQNEQEDDLRSETEAFLEQQKADLSTYFDPQFVSRLAVVQATGGQGFGYPTTLILDKTGIIRGIWSGYAPGVEEEMKALVAEMLAEA